MILTREEENVIVGKLFRGKALVALEGYERTIE